MKKPIRVLVVDDSLICRKLLSSLLSREPDIQVIATAASGAEAIQLNRKLAPDLITMDIQMPGLDGFTTIETIMATNPVPILTVTSVPVRDGVDQTFRAIQAGSLDLVRKPAAAGPEAQVLIDKVRVMAGVRVIHRQASRRPGIVLAPPLRSAHPVVELIAIACSTGGPTALTELLGVIPADFPVPILITQHLPDGFSSSFSDWLDQELRLEVAEARDGERIAPGHILIAPGGRHLTVRPPGRVHLLDTPPIQGLRPSANPMFESIAAVFGPKALGIVLTGMGCDGADGLLALRRKGGLCLAQNEASSMIFGMPRAAIELGAVDGVMDLAEIANAMLSHSGAKK